MITYLFYIVKGTWVYVYFVNYSASKTSAISWISCLKRMKVKTIKVRKLYLQNYYSIDTWVPTSTFKLSINSLALNELFKTKQENEDTFNKNVKANITYMLDILVRVYLIASVNVEETSLEFNTKNNKRNAARNSFFVRYFILHVVFYLSRLYRCYP